MRSILFVWELGGGLGHITQIVPLARGLQSADHRVVVALRELPHDAGLLDNSDIKFLKSPYKPPLSQEPAATSRTFAHVLRNAGFGIPDEIRALTDAWGNLVDSVKPDMIVFDHAPTALLAAWGLQVRRVVLGNGFCCPPDRSPLPDLRPWLLPQPDVLRDDERRVLDCMNRVLECRGVQPLERVSQIYGEVDDTFLTTLTEFDQYPDRQHALTPCPFPILPSTAGGRGELRYRGPWSMPSGAAPIWPAGRGKRIYAYLSPFPARKFLLTRLIEMGNPAIISIGATDANLPARFHAPNLQFEKRTLDLKQVAAQCDLAILNGNHGTTIAMLLGGTPTLQIPIFLEQTLNALAVKRLGAGLICSCSRPDDIAGKLAAMLSDDRFAEAAQRFAARYAGFDPQTEIAAAQERLEELLA